MSKMPKTMGLSSEARPVRAAPVPMAAPRSAAADVRRVTLRVWHEGFVDIADLAYQERTSIQALFLEGIQRVFAARGHGRTLHEVDPTKGGQGDE